MSRAAGAGAVEGVDEPRARVLGYITGPGAAALADTQGRGYGAPAPQPGDQLVLLLALPGGRE